MFLLKQKAKPSAPQSKRKKVERLDPVAASASQLTSPAKSHIVIDSSGKKKIIPEMLGDKKV